MSIESAPAAPAQARDALIVPVLMAAGIGQAIIFTVVSPVLPHIVAQTEGADASLGQLFFAMPSAGRLLIGLVAGVLFAMLGARRAMLIGLALFVVLALVPVFTTDVATVLASRFALGAVCGLMGVSAMVTLVTRYEGAKRNAMLGFQSSVGSAAGLVCLLASGAIATQLDWRWAFALYPLLMLPLLALALVSMPRGEAPKPAAGAGAATVASVKLLWPIYAVAACGFVVATMFGALTPFLLIERGEISPLAHAGVIAMTTIGTVVSAALFARIRATLGPKRNLGVGFALMGAATLGMGLAATTPLAGAAALIFGLGLGITFPHLSAAIAGLAPDELRATAFALMGTATYLGGFAYPLLVTPLLGEIGMSGAYIAFGAILVLAAIATLIGLSGKRLVTA